MIERRTLLMTDYGAAVQLIQRLLQTVNAHPIWGHPARALHLQDAAGEKRADGSVVVDLVARTEFPLLAFPPYMPYAVADWSALAGARVFLDEE